MGLTLPVGISRRGIESIELSNPATCHLLVGGVTGAGKTSFLRQMLLFSFLHYSQEELIVYLIDLKRTEFTQFRYVDQVYGIATDLEEAINIVEFLNKAIDARLDLFEKNDAVDIDSYNTKANKNFESQLPRLLLIIDELSELAPAHESSKTIKKEKEAFHNLLDRITRMGRGCGVHNVLCTQRPDVQSIPGYIKANLPATIAFKTRSQIDSQVLLGNDSSYLLSPIPGRGIYNYGHDYIEFQTVYVTPEDVPLILQSQQLQLVTRGGGERLLNKKDFALCCMESIILRRHGSEITLWDIVASRHFEIPMEQVTEEHRDLAKQLYYMFLWAEIEERR